MALTPEGPIYTGRNPAAPNNTLLRVLISAFINDDGTFRSLSTASVSPSGSVTDISGSITNGGNSQQIAAAKSDRKYFEIQNISDTTLYVNFGAAATVDNNSWKISPGGSAAWTNFVPTDAIHVIGATTGKKFVAKQA